MIQDMHRSDNLAYLTYPPFYLPRHCKTDNPKVVTVNVTDIFSTHDNVVMHF